MRTGCAGTDLERLLRAQVCYGLLNIAAASGIVFANKAVMTTFGFKFIYALTFIHTITTLFGDEGLCGVGMFEPKTLPKLSIAPLAGLVCGYIVLNNLNLQLNTVGFYQISKIAVAPAVRGLARFCWGQAHQCSVASTGQKCSSRPSHSSGLTSALRVLARREELTPPAGFAFLTSQRALVCAPDSWKTPCRAASWHLPAQHALA